MNMSASVRTWILSGLVLIPLGISLIAALCPAAATSAARGPERPPLAFDQYSVNLRRVPVQPVVRGFFQFTNLGPRVVTVTSLEPSCGCLRPTLGQDKKVYQPGESGHFLVQVETANEPAGPQEYTVRIRYEDGQPHEALVYFRVNLPERKVTVEPSELGFFQLSGQPSSKRIYVTDYRADPLEVTAVRSPIEWVSAEVAPAETDEHGRRRIPIDITVAGEVPPERQIHTLTIETSDAEFSHIRIPVLLEGVTRPAGSETLIGPPPR